MKITYIVEDCRDKISSECTGTFNREVKRGRPQVNCEPCKAALKSNVSTVNRNLSNTVEAVLGKGECPCGNIFDINPGRGRKPTKCADCRTAGTVYRADDDGKIQAIRAETLAEEAREKAEEAGRARAKALCDLMAPLIARDAKRRKVAA